MSDPLSAWAQRAALLPAALVEATPHAVTAAGEVLERQATANLRTASGGDLKLSRVRSGKGATIGVRLKSEGAGRAARSLVVPTGPVMLIEDRTKAHRLPFSYGLRRRYAMQGQELASGGKARRRKAKRAGFLWIPGVGARQFADHPGTAGKRPVRKAFAERGQEAGQAGVAVFATAARRHLHHN